MQEDDPLNTAKNFHAMISQFKIPISMQELESIKTIGIGKFHP